MGWIPLKIGLTIWELRRRWEGSILDGNDNDFEIIEQLIRDGEITAFDEKDMLIDGKREKVLGKPRLPQLGLNGINILLGECRIRFDDEEINEREKHIVAPKIGATAKQKTATQNETNLLDKEKIIELEVQLAEAQKQLEAAKQQTAKHSKTSAASEFRASEELAKWKKYAPAMVKVALRCWAEGPKKRQAKDFEKMFKDTEVKLTDNILATFRSWLPGEHTDKIGGAPSQD